MGLKKFFNSLGLHASCNEGRCHLFAIVHYTPQPIALSQFSPVSLFLKKLILCLMALGVASDNVRIWLEAKLENPWCGTHVAYLLNKDVLALIINQWATLDTTLKLRLLSCLISVKPHALRPMIDEVQQIIALTPEDGDGWVQTLGQIVSTALRPDAPEFNLSSLLTNPLTSPLLDTIKQQRAYGAFKPGKRGFLENRKRTFPKNSIFCLQ